MELELKTDWSPAAGGEVLTSNRRGVNLNPRNGPVPRVPRPQGTRPVVQPDGRTLGDPHAQVEELVCRLRVDQEETQTSVTIAQEVGHGKVRAHREACPV